MKFQYAALDAQGKRIKGTIEAESETEAIYALRGMGISPISVKPEREKPQSIWELEILEPEVHKLSMKKKDLERFADKMAIMLRAGVRLSLAMEVLIESEKDRRQKKIYRRLLTDLYAGVSLADSMRAFRAFPEAVVNMVASGEKNGKLDWAFERIAETYQKELTLRGKAASALAYPAFLCLLAILLFVVMTTVILPQFSAMYATLGANLPALTRALMGISDFLRQKGWLLLLAGIGAGVGVALLFQYHPGVRDRLSGFALKLPVLGRLGVTGNVSSFCRVTTALLQSGVEVVEAIRIGSSVVKNSHMRHGIEASLELVALGSSLHGAFRKKKLFEPLFLSMIQIGEETGELSETFRKMADLYEAESNQASRRLSAVLEPVLTMAIGLVIALMVVAVILPMFDMYSVVLS